MPDNPPRVYLDANVYLAWLRGEEGRVETARELLTAGEEERMIIVASTLIYAEVCGHGEVRNPELEEINEKISAFFERGFIKWIEVDLPTSREARGLSLKFGLRGADAIHLASAIRGRAKTFMTWDTDFPIGQDIDGIAIREPAPLGQGTLSL